MTDAPTKPRRPILRLPVANMAATLKLSEDEVDPPALSWGVAMAAEAQRFKQRGSRR